MLDDNVRIRAAIPEEAEALSELAWRSKEYYGCTLEMMNCFRDFLTLTHDFLENNPSYVIEDVENGDILGFYSLERDEPGEVCMRHYWVVPERAGTETGQILFLHACEIAETVGAEKISIISDPNSEAFYLHMGAERVGLTSIVCGGTEQSMPLLEMKLG